MHFQKGISFDSVYHIVSTLKELFKVNGDLKYFVCEKFRQVDMKTTLITLIQPKI